MEFLRCLVRNVESVINGAEQIVEGGNGRLKSADRLQIFRSVGLFTPVEVSLGTLIAPNRKYDLSLPRRLGHILLPGHDHRSGPRAASIFHRLPSQVPLPRHVSKVCLSFLAPPETEVGSQEG